MKYYEKEVLSVPAGKTIEIVDKYFIHAHPNNEKYNYKTSIYITFRNSGGGEMTKLYKVDETLILPTDCNVLKELLDDSLEYKESIINYVKERNEGMGLNQESEYRFYVLNKADYINLKNSPKPKRNNSGGWYYKISELLSGKEFVNVDMS